MKEFWTKNSCGNCQKVTSWWHLICLDGLCGKSNHFCWNGMQWEIDNEGWKDSSHTILQASALTSRAPTLPDEHESHLPWDWLPGYTTLNCYCTCEWNRVFTIQVPIVPKQNTNLSSGRSRHETGFFVTFLQGSSTNMPVQSCSIHILCRSSTPKATPAFMNGSEVQTEGH